MQSALSTVLTCDTSTVILFLIKFCVFFIWKRFLVNLIETNHVDQIALSCLILALIFFHLLLI